VPRQRQKATQMSLSPDVPQALTAYQHGIQFHPSPGFVSRWAPGTGPKRTNYHRKYHGPLHASHVGTGIRGLGDGDGLGDGALASIFSAITGAGTTALAPIQAKADQLESAIRIILLFSGIAAATGTVQLLRGR
jgi:hypothetical protein